MERTQSQSRRLDEKAVQEGVYGRPGDIGYYWNIHFRERLKPLDQVY